MTEIKWSDFAAIVLPAKRNETTQNQFSLHSCQVCEGHLLLYNSFLLALVIDLFFVFYMTVRCGKEKNIWSFCDKFATTSVSLQGHVAESDECVRVWCE